MNQLCIEIPLRINVELGDIGNFKYQMPASALLGKSGSLERVPIDPDYANRKGYDPDFLGVKVPAPALTEEQQRNAAKNSAARNGEDPAILPYHHFSIVMNRRRQLAYYTAVNIDGNLSKSPKRSGDEWHFDPRIAESEQIGEDLYARNQLDRGHLVRRLDPAWGETNSEANTANNDTFHFTNCSPQHERFNQNDDTWQGVENYLLDGAVAAKRKLTIFTGPVMADDDPIYRGVRIPLQFWKIAVYADSGQQLNVAAFVLGQEDLVGGLERFSPETWQVTVDEVIERTGLNFSHLLSGQPDLSGAHGLERARTTRGATPRFRIKSVDDIRLRSAR